MCKMKLSLIFGLLMLSLTIKGQTSNLFAHKPLTSKYAGIFTYGSDQEKGGIGTIIIYPETDTTVLFYIDLNRGAPSYNMGSLYGRVILKNDAGSFYTELDQADKGCKWTFNFVKDSLTIETITGYYDCGFGNAVYADGVYKKQSYKLLEYFEDMEGEKVYFSKTKPEDYYK
jgi:hypothetical protein